MPPIVPFADLEGSAYQVSLLLTTRDEELHRSRFVARGRREGRAGERYLDHFEAIRLLQETHDRARRGPRRASSSRRPIGTPRSSARCGW